MDLHEQEDEDLARRIRAFAEFGATAPPKPNAARHPRTRPWSGLAALAGVAVVGVVAGVLFAFAAKNNGVGVRPTATPSPTPVVSSAPSTAPSPSSGAVGPATIKGETPSPDSTPPPTIAFLPGVTLATLADLGGTLAMDCVSYGPGGERPSPYLLRCEVLSDDKTTQVFFEAGYWTLNAVRDISLTVIFAPGQTTVDKQFAAAAVAALGQVRYSGADITATRQWAVAGLDKPECSGNGCSRVVSGVRVLLTVGYGGALGMTLEPA